jgi:hypothetical protein
MIGMGTSRSPIYTHIEHNERRKTSGWSRPRLPDGRYPQIEQNRYNSRWGKFPAPPRPAAMRRMDAGLNKIHLGAVTGGRTSTPRKEVGAATNNRHMQIAARTGARFEL